MFDRIYLTGFLPFTGVKINPTELIVKDFMENPHPNVVKATRLDVSVKEVDQYLEKTKEQIKDSQAKILNLHLGVGPNKVYFLEKCCYNNKDFRCPDNTGYSCQNTKITPHKQLDEAIQTNLDLEYLANKLGKKHDVEISSDPGRYLCNYIYYASTERLCDKNNVSSLFVHFPDVKKKSHEENMKFMKDLLKVLTNKE